MTARIDPKLWCTPRAQGDEAYTRENMGENGRGKTEKRTEDGGTSLRPHVRTRAQGGLGGLAVRHAASTRAQSSPNDSSFRCGSVGVAFTAQNWREHPQRRTYAYSASLLTNVIGSPSSSPSIGSRSFRPRGRRTLFPRTDKSHGRDTDPAENESHAEGVGLENAAGGECI